MPKAAGRPEQPLDITAGPLARLAGELRQLRGARTYRELAELTGLSTGTLTAAAKGERLPTWAVTEAFAAACEAEGTAVETVRELWKDACAAEGRPVPSDPQDTPPVPEAGALASAAEFIGMMNQLRAWAGTPSLAELNRRAGGHNLLPPATLSDVLRRRRLPRLELVLAYARACGLNSEQAAAWEQAWAALRERDLSPEGRPPAEPPAELPSRAARALARRESARTASRNFLIWLSGARPELLRHSRTDRPAYTGIGAAILITGAVAGVSAVFALQTVLYAPWPFAVPLGAAWGAAIMAVDRHLAFTIRRGGYLKILLAVVPRVALSVLFAFIFAMPLLLRMFAPEIAEQINVMNQVRAQQYSTALDHSAISEQIATLKQQLANAQARLNADSVKWQCEVQGCGSNSHPGVGAVARALQEQVAEDHSQVSSLQVQLAQADNELAHLQQQQADIIIHGTPGLLERLEALDQVAAASAVLAVTRALVILFFIVVGCLPLLVRTLHVLGPQGTYEKLLEIQERADIQNGSLHIRNKAPLGERSPLPGNADKAAPPAGEPLPVGRKRPRRKSPRWPAAGHGSRPAANAPDRGAASPSAPPRGQARPPGPGRDSAARDR